MRAYKRWYNFSMFCGTRGVNDITNIHQQMNPPVLSKRYFCVDSLVCNALVIRRIILASSEWGKVGIRNTLKRYIIAFPRRDDRYLSTNLSKKVFLNNLIFTFLPPSVARWCVWYVSSLNAEISKNSSFEWQNTKICTWICVF